LREGYASVADVACGWDESEVQPTGLDETREGQARSTRPVIGAVVLGNADTGDAISWRARPRCWMA
jgi:hypothetical protein